MLGSLGDIVFEVAEDYVLTFNELSFSRSANYAGHKIIGSDELLEFTGKNAASCNIKMIFDISLGINPKDQVDALEAMLDEHEAVLFVLDGQLVGTGYWVIESLNETIELVDKFGGADRISVTATMKEYR